jgi:hypothetical protein
VNEPSAVLALLQVPADVNVSLPLGSAKRELKRLAKGPGAGAVAPWTVEDVSRSGERTESTESMEGVLEGTGEMTCSLPPQETM